MMTARRDAAPVADARKKGMEMTIATALLVTVLCAGTDREPLQAPNPAAASTPDRQQATSGIVIGADIGGRLAIFDSQHRAVVELDKPAGRPLQIALDPGVYEARLGGPGSRRIRFQVGEGQQLPIGLAAFREPDAGPPQGTGEAAGLPAPPNGSRPLDRRHRIELRLGGWGNGGYHDGRWDNSGPAQAALGFEYLNFVRNDVGVGVGLSTLARGDWQVSDDSGAGQATVGIPVVVRWYPLRRVTRTRSVEPYVTGGIGPVFLVHWAYTHDWEHDTVSRARAEMSVGGRLGGGMDIRLGSIFTIGVAGAWNWDAGFSDSTWQGNRPSGGELSVVFGWAFGG
jgi:hypothetical protein